MSIIVNITPAKEQEILRASKWYNRQFKTKVELRKTWPTGDLTIAPEMRAPLYTNWIPKTGVRGFAYVINSAANESSALKIEHLLRTWGREGEAYQDAFDACFCEEIFVPLATPPELENSWNAVTDLTVFEPGREYEVTWCRTVSHIEEQHFSRGIYNVKGHFERREPKYIGETTGINPIFWRFPKVISHPDHNWVLFAEHKPYDGATCDLCYSSQEITDQEWQTAEYQHWISHPGGEATANAGPGFVDEYGFPAYEDPIWWRYAEDLPPLPEEKYKSITKEVVDGYIEDAMAAPLVVGTKGPELDLEELEDMFHNPESYQSSSKPTPSEDDDYYSTL